MSFFEELKKALTPTKEPDYFRRNSGKKVMATILEDTPLEAKEKKDDTTDPR